MADAFDFTSSTQRRVVMGVLLVYILLFVVELATGSVLAAAGADLLLAVLAIPGSVLVASRVLGREEPDWLVLGAAVAFFVAGVTIGYEGLATLGLLPTVAVVEFVGTLALLAALVLYFIGRE